MPEESKVKFNIVQTAFWMAVLTLGSKVFGFVREMTMASFFGTSYIVDAYVMAQTIPAILVAAFFSAIATAYMPMLSERIEIRGEETGRSFTSQVIKILLAFSIAVSLFGIAFSSGFVAVFAPGFEGETVKLTSFFLKVTFSYLILTSVSGILESYIQYKGVFIPQILVGYLQNIVYISIIVISALTTHYLLAFGILIAHSIRLTVFAFLAKKKGFRYLKSSDKLKETIKQIAILGIPVFIGSGMQQINLFVDRMLASGLREGSIAALNYGAILNTLIMSLSITVLTTLIYPRLNKASARDEMEHYVSLLNRGLVIVVMVALPFSLGAMVYSSEVVQIVFERGAFDVNATSLTATAYLFYSVGLLFMAVNDLMLRGYYALHDMKTPMIYAGIGVVVNITLNLLLIKSMAHGGLALATSIAALVNCVLLLSGFRKKIPEGKLITSYSKFGKIGVSSFVAVGFSKGVYELLVRSLWMPRMIYLGVAVLLAVGAYWVLLRVFKVEEIDLIKNLFKKGHGSE